MRWFMLLLLFLLFLLAGVFLVDILGLVDVRGAFFGHSMMPGLYGGPMRHNALSWAGLLVVALAIGFCVLALFFIVFMRAIGRSAQSRALTEEDSDMLRQLWDAQDRMEERLTNLETILLERRR